MLRSDSGQLGDSFLEIMEFLECNFRKFWNFWKVRGKNFRNWYFLFGKPSKADPLSGSSMGVCFWGVGGGLLWRRGKQSHSRPISVSNLCPTTAARTTYLVLVLVPVAMSVISFKTSISSTISLDAVSFDIRRSTSINTRIIVHMSVY